VDVKYLLQIIVYVKDYYNRSQFRGKLRRLVDYIFAFNGALSLKALLNILPDALFGIASRNSTPPSIHFARAALDFTKFRSIDAVSAPRDMPLSRTINAST
jgi:hypothetical protein